jgi:putative ABC transport system permease protein
MFGRLILLASRNLKRNFLYTIIVIGGMVLGMVTFIAIIHWTSWQFSYDRHVTGAEDIYRISVEEKRENFERHMARILHGDIVNQLYLESDQLGIESIARLSPYRNAIVKKDNLTFYEDKSFSCDSTFLDLFDARVLMGNRSSMLSQPYSIVLTQTLAKKYFGTEDPLGKTLKIMHQFASEPEAYVVTGVIEDFPANTHFRISLLTSYEDPDNFVGTAWVYAKLNPLSDPEKVSKRILEFIGENNSEEYAAGLQPRMIRLTDIHLKSHLARELEQNVQLKSVLVIFFAGMLVFLLAWFNFTLLSVSHNQLKIQQFIYQWQCGAGRRAFFRQFFTEYMLAGTISLALAVLLSVLLSEQIYSLIHIRLTENMPLFFLSTGVLLVLLVISSLITSLYVTYRIYRIVRLKYLSAKTSPIRSLSGKNLFVRSVIVLEFVITFILIANLAMIRKQVHFAVSTQIGANDHTTIQIPNVPRPIVNNYELFREKILDYPQFRDVTAMMEEPGGMAMDAFPYFIDGFPQNHDRLFVFPVDRNFFGFYGIEFIAGNDFPSTFSPEDTVGYYILNETAARRIAGDDLESLVGRELSLDFQYEGFIFPGKIYGVVKDFYLSTLEREVTPMAIFPNHVWLYCFSLRINGDETEAVEALSTIWKETFPNYPLRYYFTSELYDQVYQNEFTEIRVLIVFSILSFLIAGTGLFALSGFLMHRKMHAAAIRKINGAGIVSILVPELTQYLVLALLSSAIAVPVSLIIIRNWMSNFVYQATVDAWLFPACGVILLLFSWIAVIYHSWRLANLNPVNFIRSE